MARYTGAFKDISAIELEQPRPARQFAAPERIPRNSIMQFSEM